MQWAQHAKEETNKRVVLVVIIDHLPHTFWLLLMVTCNGKFIEKHFSSLFFKGCEKVSQPANAALSGDTRSMPKKVCCQKKFLCWKSFSSILRFTPDASAVQEVFHPTTAFVSCRRCVFGEKSWPRTTRKVNQDSGHCPKKLERVT